MILIEFFSEYLNEFVIYFTVVSWYIHVYIPRYVISWTFLLLIVFIWKVQGVFWTFGEQCITKYTQWYHAVTDIILNRNCNWIAVKEFLKFNQNFRKNVLKEVKWG